MRDTSYLSQSDIRENVASALREDIGDGDITAALVPASLQYRASVICRDSAILCGRDWVDETFKQVDDTIAITWYLDDGDAVNPGQLLFTALGPARSLLTAERTALNFLQLLSGTATQCHQFAQQVADTNVRLLDTRKTIPGLRNAQKYAVSCGGCFNHRIGLYDAYLIKENHIAACGSIAKAISQAKTNAPGKTVEIEVENLDELQQALDAGADIVMLDNFSLAQLSDAVKINNKHAKLEASGNINSDSLLPIAQSGVDFISIGALTKNVQAIDLSMSLASEN